MENECIIRVLQDALACPPPMLGPWVRAQVRATHLHYFLGFSAGLQLMIHDIPIQVIGSGFETSWDARLLRWMTLIKNFKALLMEKCNMTS